MRKIPRYATELFACSKAAGDWMFGGASYRVMNNAIDARQFEFNKDISKAVLKELGILEETFVVGHVGRFFEQKNHTFLIDIFKEIHLRNEKSVLLLVGDGELRKDIEAKVTSLGLENHVIFAGVRNNVHELLQAMDVFVFSSLYEGLGIVLIEAQAAGLPCFASDIMPEECEVTNLLNRISLTEPADVWADIVLQNKSVKRISTYDMILKAGYDISKNAEWLQDYYLKKWNEEV